MHESSLAPSEPGIIERALEAALGRQLTPMAPLRWSELAEDPTVEHDLQALLRRMTGDADEPAPAPIPDERARPCDAAPEATPSPAEPPVRPTPPILAPPPDQHDPIALVAPPPAPLLLPPAPAHATAPRAWAPVFAAAALATAALAACLAIGAVAVGLARSSAPVEIAPTNLPAPAELAQATVGAAPVDAPPPTPNPEVAAAPVASPSRTHVVAAGETLSRIAQARLGDWRRYPELAERNASVVSDVDRIEVGWELALP